MTDEQARRILTVSNGASQEEIRKAHRELAKVWHPDRFSHESESLRSRANDQMLLLNEAFRVLSKSASIVDADTHSAEGTEGPQKKDNRGQRPARSESRARRAGVGEYVAYGGIGLLILVLISSPNWNAGSGRSGTEGRTTGLYSEPAPSDAATQPRRGGTNQSPLPHAGPAPNSVEATVSKSGETDSPGGMPPSSVHSQSVVPSSLPANGGGDDAFAPVLNLVDRFARGQPSPPSEYSKFAPADPAPGSVADLYSKLSSSLEEWVSVRKKLERVTPI